MSVSRDLLLWLDSILREVRAVTPSPAGMGLQEVVLCATAPQQSDSASGPGAFVLHDLQSSNVLSSFKQTCSAPHCSAFVETKDRQGGIMLAAQSDKALLNVYNFQKACTSQGSSAND